MTALTIDALREALGHMEEAMNGVPVGIATAPDVAAELKKETSETGLMMTHPGTAPPPSILGLPWREMHVLHPGEWFTYDAAGNVLQSNGDPTRINMVARALTMPSLRYGYRSGP